MSAFCPHACAIWRASTNTLLIARKISRSCADLFGNKGDPLQSMALFGIWNDLSYILRAVQCIERTAMRLMNVEIKILHLLNAHEYSIRRTIICYWVAWTCQLGKGTLRHDYLRPINNEPTRRNMIHMIQIVVKSKIFNEQCIKCLNKNKYSF